MFDLDTIFPVALISILLTPFVLAPAVFIRAVVRWVNRRDDPRCVKPPSDPP
jgi:hypothetical protein